MMTRLQKKCFIASSAFHGLLILVLLFGAALMPEPPENTFQPITFYDPSKVSDLLTSGSGVPTPAMPPPQPNRATPPAAKPPVEPPAPRHVEVPKPIEEPPKPKIAEKPAEHWYEFKWTKPKTESKTDLAKEEPTQKPKHKIVFDSSDLKPKERSRDDSAKAAQDSETNAERRRAAQQFAEAFRTISKQMSTSTLVDMPSDAGLAGEVSVNYRDIIASKYYNAWVAPSELDDASTPVVIARVTIARSGDVISAHVIQSSGNAAMDRSIENVLQTVTFIEPFPAGSKDQERTVTIKFNLQTKREIG
jgi:colicin import membrane protein